MNPILRPLSFVLAAVAAVSAATAADPAPVDAEVVFVLDTTGSMSGLIEGAKQKIWSIAGGIMERTGGEVRIGLVPYRDREWMRTGECAACKYFKYCLGGGMHLRDDRGGLLFCHLKRIA